MKALQGVTVIDLSRVLSGPYCTMTLGDYGADVVKVEPPTGDDTRVWGPPFVNGESAYFLSVNRNKRSVVIDLKNEVGRQLLLRLLEKADVVVENFRPGTIERLGIGYDVMKEVNPRIILASISGFGQTGPHAHKPGYDVIAQGMGGLASVTGEPGRAPVKAGFSVADIGTGMWAVIGILNALVARGVSGTGQWVDCSLMDTMVSWQTYLAGNYFASGENPVPLGGAHPSIVPYQLFATADGFVNVAVGNEKLWSMFCRVVDVRDLETDPRYATNADRVRNRDDLVELLSGKFLTRKTSEWTAMFDSVGVPSGPVLTLEGVFADPQVIAREQMISMMHPVAGTIRMTGMPVKLSDTPGSADAPPPMFGQHTDEVLVEMLGLAPSEIVVLRQQQVIL